MSFLILVGGDGWEERPPPARCSRLVYSDDWVRVYSSDLAAAWALPDGDGILLGRLFTRSGPLSTGLSASTMLLRDEDVQSSCWGDYCIVRGGSLTKASVYRSPAATTPCYYRIQDGCAAIASDVGLLASAFATRPTICWDGVAFQLVANGLPSYKTALAGILEVERGTRLVVTRLGSRIERLWDPWTFVDPDDRGEPGTEPGRLRATIIECVEALGSDCQTPFLSLSGGLDSSIVAAACSAAGIRPRCFTMVDKTPSGDERCFAEAVARRFNVDLEAQSYDMDMIDITKPSFPHMPRPIGRILGQSLIAVRRRYRPSTGGATLLTGIGGDNVFCFLQSATPVADAIIERRWSTAWSSLVNVSRLSGASLFTVGVAAIERFSRPARYAWSSNCLFLDESLTVESPIRFDHPWLDASPGRRPGSAAHIANLMRLQTTIEEPAPDSGWEQLNPLLSQPVIELCLGIPSWAWCAGGRDRAVARAAFGDDLPSLVLDRRHKGGPEGFCIAVLERHRRLIRERLLGGHLMARGLLDAPAIERALADDQRFRSSEYLRLLELVDAEAWAEHWLA